MNVGQVFALLTVLPLIQSCGDKASGQLNGKWKATRNAEVEIVGFEEGKYSVGEAPNELKFHGSFELVGDSLITNSDSGRTAHFVQWIDDQHVVLSGPHGKAHLERLAP